jgi:prepilin signal peptidase PulO-like enzyme (type II secretory pathway)
VAAPRLRMSDTPGSSEAFALPPREGARVPHLHTVAAVAGGVAVAAAFAHLGLTARAFVSSFVIVVLLVLAVIDFERRLIPNRIVLPALAVVLVAQLALFPDRAAEWILSALGAGLLFLVPAVVKRGSVGMGDVKLAVLLGAALGMHILQAMAFGLLAAWPVAFCLVLRDGRSARTAALPLAPFMAFGAIVTLILS